MIDNCAYITVWIFTLLIPVSFRNRIVYVVEQALYSIEGYYIL
jgi:hypothetical protein